jgi:hypothetical protein
LIFSAAKFAIFRVFAEKYAIQKVRAFELFGEREADLRGQFQRALGVDDFAAKAKSSILCHQIW